MSYSFNKNKKTFKLKLLKYLTFFSIAFLCFKSQNTHYMNKRRKYNCNAAYFKNECVYLFFYEGKVRHQTGFFFLMWGPYQVLLRMVTLNYMRISSFLNEYKNIYYNPSSFKRHFCLNYLLLNNTYTHARTRACACMPFRRLLM